MLSAPELGDYIRSHLTRTAFRLETLDRYDVSSDGGDFDRFLHGEPQPLTERKQAWRDRLQRERAVGITRQRVHVLRTPLTDYQRFECEWGHALNLDIEDIRVLDLAEHVRPAGIPDHDFWLLDDEHVLRMHYDEAGRFVGADRVDDPAPYLLGRDVAVSAAGPFIEWWARHPEEWRVNRAA